MLHSFDSVSLVSIQPSVVKQSCILRRRGRGWKNLPYTVLVFYETLVVATDGDQEKQAMDILEAMNPFLPL